MSMSVRCDGCGLEYAGARGLRRRVRRPAEPRATRASSGCSSRCKRFHRRARAVLETPEPDRRASSRSESSWTDGRYSPLFRAALHGARRVVRVVVPARRPRSPTRPGRCSRSSTTTAILTVTGSPHWRTVVGGSRTLRRTRGQGAHRHRARRRPSARSPNRPTASRSVTTATRPAPSTERWSRPTPTRRSPCSPSRPRPNAAVLGAFDYSVNETILHTDALGSYPRAPRPGFVELPPGGVRRRRRGGAGELRHEPAPPARRAAPIRRHVERRRADPRRARDRAHAVHASRCTPANRSARRSDSPS